MDMYEKEKNFKEKVFCKNGFKTILLKITKGG